jgi:hypothetical protein
MKSLPWSKGSSSCSIVQSYRSVQNITDLGFGDADGGNGQRLILIK